jgi:hypothetical protein
MFVDYWIDCVPWYMEAAATGQLPEVVGESKRA